MSFVSSSFSLPPRLTGVSHCTCGDDHLTLLPCTPRPPAGSCSQCEFLLPSPIPSHALSPFSLQFCFHRERFLVQRSPADTVWLLRYSAILSHPLHLTLFSVTLQHTLLCNKTSSLLLLQAFHILSYLCNLFILFLSSGIPLSLHNL